MQYELLEVSTVLIPGFEHQLRLELFEQLEFELPCLISFNLRNLVDKMFLTSKLLVLSVPAMLAFAKNDGFLWRINSKPHPAYLFGTIHVPYTKVWPSVPKRAKTAFHNSNRLYTEINALDHQQELNSCRFLPEGQYASQILPPQLYKKVKRRVNRVRRKLHTWLTYRQKRLVGGSKRLLEHLTGNWEQMHPAGIEYMLYSMKKRRLQSLDVPILDLYLTLQSRFRREVGGLETMDVICQSWKKMPIELAILQLKLTIRTPRKAHHAFVEDLIDNYNNGAINETISMKSVADLRSKIHITEKDSILLKELDYLYYENELKQRNEQWVAKIDDLLKNEHNHRYFFAFGIGHFFGEDNVVELLREVGYKVTRVTNKRTKFRHYKKS